MLRRLIPLVLIFSLVSAICPAPAYALSTDNEVLLGKQADEDITAQSVIDTDPLINAWVNGVASSLWKQVARKDVPYNIKVIHDYQINAFSTLGGYVYAYDGVLDFVQSDDELAQVIGHETGHIERRHVVTAQAKGQALGLLLGIASLFSPLVYRFGNLAQAGIMAKVQRNDELQADQTGLQLMSRAGYDPQGALTSTQHLGVLEDAHSDLIDKYLEDHPGATARAAHMLGYDELDPTKVTDSQRLVAALHNLDEARYAISAHELGELAKKDPNNEQAELGLGQAELALGQTSKSEQTLGELAQKGSPNVKAIATERIAALREMETHRVTLTQPNIEDLRGKLKAADQTQTQAVSQILMRHDQGRDQLKAIQNRLDSLSYEIPDFSRVQIKSGSRLESIVKNLSGMSRSINSAIGDAGNAISSVGSLDTHTNRVQGLLAENGDILTEMGAPLKMSPIPSDSVATLPAYPRMLSEIADADGNMVRAVDAARASAMQLDQALGDLDAFLKRVNQVGGPTVFGDISQVDFDSIVPLMQKADASLGQAAVSASQADQLYNMARSDQLAARLSLLGLGNSPQRYATLVKALNVRFGNVETLDYEAMLHHDLTPGEVAAATIVAADTRMTPDEVVSESENSHKSIVDVANAHGMHTFALELFLGLVYLDYTDDPYKEMHPDGALAPKAQSSV